MDGVIALFTERPYVVAFLCSFLVIATAERGFARMLFWLASGTFIGWLMEFSSTRNGFPFGSYGYNEHLFADEIWLGGVPLFASLSFAFLSYFGYSATCTLLGKLERRGLDVQRRADPALERSLVVLIVAAVTTTWMDLVMDPVTHLGEYWFLGDLYAYQGDGQHFDVPLTNYAGWLLTIACIVLINQRFDGLLAARSVAVSGSDLPARPLWAIGTIAGNFSFMIGVTIYLMVSGATPASVPINEILVSGVAISAAFAVFASVMLLRGMNSEPAATPEPLSLSPQRID